ncbi:unnamed protein product [Rotaria socialis]|uniref:Kinesin motor domain-containing protein n=12 Tax=Rotaria TaxID=231623 RepID=A0A818JSF9_9BILA|nr:unnamed protein product [Rotaria socialis]CAF3619547.1 unnamed protein product [Rotaria socialis]CAF4377220.1 unnamed protein product [Rotaria socialis]CAF4478565.1 unnamed protein product [Rotaria socialis]
MESANLNKEIASSVKAAVRVRPLSKNEEHDLCQTCVDVQRATNEIILANSTAFTFDHVFLPDTTQDDVYRECIYDMIEGCFQGYSASILAYGQTGSGKTFTMGSGIEYSDPTKEGILPRAIMHIFQRCASYEREAELKDIALSKCVVSCQFIEIYNENIYDLFNKENIDFRSQKNSDKHVVFENSNGEIAVTNITTRFVTTAHETLDCLKEGALSRTTAATRMNSVSSRSHAIFTVNLQFERVVPSVATSNPSLREQIRAKIHFVDLAGSESLKRTGATGQRAKEGISINSGLLVLGNVISILGDPLKKGAHVPYRDSKLTRLLQDSLGGNSRTLMIACISPVDRDFSETKSTLNYAQRARNIRNRVKVNQDKHSRQIIQLQMEIERLRALVDKNEHLSSVDYDQASNSALNQELERIRSYIYTIQRSINETNNVSQALKHDLESVRDHRLINDTTFDYDQALNQCLMRSDEIQSRLSRMIDVSHVLRKRSPLSCRRKSRLTRSFSADLPVTVEFSQGTIGSDDLQPCIEDIRHEIDRLRREEQLLRGSGSAKSNRIGVSTIPGSPQEPHELQDQQKSDAIYPLSTNPSTDIDNPSNMQILDEQENMVNSDEDDEQVQLTGDDVQTESDVQEEKLVIITTEINAKQKCLEMLESARKRSDQIRQRYEERIKTLSERIQNAEDEKQAAVTKLNTAARDQHNIEELKSARRDYEEKIRRLEIENNELTALRAQYTVCLKDGEYYKKELAKHTNELKDLRKMKVQLTRELRQEFIRHRAAEQAKAREIATLKRTQMQKDNVIRTLRAQHKQKEMILKRKQEEVHLLRRQMRSARMRKTTKEMTEHFAAIQQGITNAIRRRKLIAGINRDMNTLIENRERASRKRERFCKRLNKTIVLSKIDQEKPEEAVSTPVRDSITKLDSTIAYLNSEIASCQQVLMAYDDEQQSSELIQGPDPQFIVDCVNDIDELRYLLTKLIEQTIEKGFEADEANELMSYVDLVENILVKKDAKPATTHNKKVATDAGQDDSMDTTPVPEDSLGSKTMILRPLCNIPSLPNYQNEPMCSD